MDDFAEFSIENVVTKIFENINEGSDRVSVKSLLELVSSFIQPSTTEFASFKEIIYSMSSDGLISESQTKSALIILTKQLRKESDSCSSVDKNTSLLNTENSDPNSYTNYFNSDHQEQHIEMLKNELKDKEHSIFALKSQLDSVLLHAQLQEEANNMFEIEKAKLEEKLNRFQNDHILLFNIREEYDELKSSYEMLKDNNICLKEKVENLKTEIALLHVDFDLLNKEKQKLLQNLSKLEDDRKSDFDKLSKAGNQIECLRAQTAELFDEISKKEVTIKNLTAENVDLKMNNDFNSLVQKSVSPATSTPRNNESLMHELNNVDSFIANEQSTNMEEISQNLSSKVVRSSHSKVNENVQDTCALYYDVISQLEDELDVQKNTNTNIMENLDVECRESILLESELENLNKLICNMKNCLHVLKMCCDSIPNAMRDTKTGMKVLLFLMKRNCMFVERQHNSILMRIMKINKRTPRIDDALVKYEKINQTESFTDEKVALETHKLPFKSLNIFFIRTIVLICFLMLYNTVFGFYFPRKFSRIFCSLWDWSRFEEVLGLVFNVERVGIIPT